MLCNIYWAKKESIDWWQYNYFLIKTKMLNSITIWYSYPLSPMDYANIYNTTQALLGLQPIK